MRTSNSAAQCMYPMGDYAAKELGMKRAITVSDDFAFGHEQVGGFQRVFEDAGGRVVKNLVTAGDAGLHTVHFTDSGLRFCGLRPYWRQSAALHETVQGSSASRQPVGGGSTLADDSIMKGFGDEAIGMYSSIPYSLDIDTEANKRFLASIRKYYGNDIGIGLYNAAFYVNGQMLEAALEITGGKIDDQDAFIKAVKSVALADTPRGPISFDEQGNVIINDYIRKAEKKDGKIVNTTIKTYPKVSQFWTYDPKQFLQQPVYSRDYPPMKT